jgi:hypothetical protein
LLRSAAAVLAGLGSTLGAGEDTSERSDLVAAMFSFATAWGDRWPRSERSGEHLDALLVGVGR